MKRTVASVGLSVATIVGLAITVRADELYRINLTPPVHAGDRLHYSAIEDSSEQFVSLQSLAQRRESGPFRQDTVLEPGKRSSFGVTLDATVDVKTCDAKDRPSQMEVTVHSLTVNQNPINQLMQPGTQVTARSVIIRNEPRVAFDSFTLKEAPLEPIQDHALRRVLTVGDEKTTTEQEEFGTDKSQPIGGSWSLDGEVGAKLFARMKIVADPRHVTGIARLTGKSVIGGTECLDVRMMIACDDYQPALPHTQYSQGGTASGLLFFHIAKETGQVISAKYMAHVNFTTWDSNSSTLSTSGEYSFDKSRSIEIRSESK